MSLEIEKKYRLTEEQRKFVLAALDELGAEFQGEDAEENTIYGGGILDGMSAILRIRKTQDKTILTFKQRVESASDVKQQIEHESEFSDLEGLRKIIESLGFEPRLVYEKRRKTWKFRSVEIVVDELPFGLYMEIEGPVTGIKEAEMILDIEDFETEHETYPRLASRLGKVAGGIVEARFEKAFKEGS
jgi:adenylate cyclase, class 2